MHRAVELGRLRQLGRRCHANQQIEPARSAFGSRLPYTIVSATRLTRSSPRTEQPPFILPRRTKLLRVAYSAESEATISSVLTMVLA